MPTAKIIFSQDYHLLQILLDILNKFSRIKKYPKLVKKKKIMWNSVKDSVPLGRIKIIQLDLKFPPSC